MGFERLALALLGLSVLAGVPACKKDPGGPDPRKRPVPVVVAPVEKKDVPMEVRAVGAAEAVNTVEVLPQVGGLIQGVHFKEGQAVRKGDLLFTIDTRPYRASLSAARADVDKSRALAEQAKREVGRYEKLAKEGLVSDQELSQVRANAAALSATLEAGRAAVASNDLNVQFASIRSPIDGRTGTLLVKAGNVVKPNDSRALVVIRSIAPIYVRFAVPEQYLSSVRDAFRGGELPVTAKPHGDDAHFATGKLTFIENTVDTSTGKIDMKAQFDNDHEALWPGQYVDVVMRVGIENDVIVVPESAVQTGQDGPYLYVVSDGHAQLRRLEVVRTQGAEVVVRRGVSIGEQVVTDGQIRLRDGSSVELKPAPPPRSAPSAEPAPAPRPSGEQKRVGEAAR